MVATAKVLPGNAVMPFMDRAPPQALDAEAAVLSTLMLDGGLSIDEVRAVLADPSAFYSEANKIIYETVCELSDEGSPRDTVTVAERLRLKDRLGRIGGPPYLAMLTDATPAVTNVRSHAEIVRDCWRLRQMLVLSQMTVAEIYGQNTGPSVQDFLSTLEERVSDLARSSVARELRPVGDWLREAQGFIFAAQSGERGIIGIATGFARLDKRTTGYGRGDLVYIAGRPGQGKTAFALAVAQRIASRGEAVAFFSLEMPGYQVALRLIAAEARVDLLRLRSGLLRQSELSAVMTAIAELSKLPIFIDDTPAIGVYDVRARAKRLAREIETGKIACGPLSLVAIDYMQLMSAPRLSAGANREQQVAALSRELKETARTLNVPVAPLSQLNRDVERRGGDKRPQLSDLRESGQIEADADLVQFLYRDEYYNKDSPDAGIAEVITAKQRNGPTGTDRLAFADRCTRFDNLEDAPAPEQKTFNTNQLPLPSAGYDDYEERDD